MPNCLYDIFINIRDAPATYLDNGIASLPCRASSKMGLKWAGPENFQRKQAGPGRA